MRIGGIILEFFKRNGKKSGFELFLLVFIGFLITENFGEIPVISNLKFTGNIPEYYDFWKGKFFAVLWFNFDKIPAMYFQSLFGKFLIKLLTLNYYFVYTASFQNKSSP